MRNKIYFLADLHLGSGTYSESLSREKRVIAWLSEKQMDARAFYFLGDIFEFWFEYTHACPKYFLRFFAKILELRQQEIEVHFFIGNHDLWMFDYFEKELDVRVHREPFYLKTQDKTFFLAHGDGLDEKEKGYIGLRKIFVHPFFITLFRFLGPEIGMRLAFFSSKKSREYGKNEKSPIEKNQGLIDFSEKKLKNETIDYFIFGHQHAPLKYQLSKNSLYFNTGDWLIDHTYIVWDGTNISLEKFTE